MVFFAVNTAALALRRDPAEPGHFRAPTVLPVLGAASCVLLATRIEAAVWLRGLAVLGTGLVLGAIVAARRGAARAAEDRAANG